MADEQPKAYRVKVALRHDGKDYRIGSRINLDPKDAAAIGEDVLEPIGKQETK